MPGRRGSSLPMAAHVVALLQDGPLTRFGARDMLYDAGTLTARDGDSEPIGRWLDALHAAKAVHICRWVRAPRGATKEPIPVYQLGPGQDAPKP